MPFSDSCRNVHLEGSDLHAECRTDDGINYRPSTLSLDTVLGNVEGEFRWGDRDFSKSARSIQLEHAQLSAGLMNSRGQWIHATLDLNAKITNRNGVLEVITEDSDVIADEKSVIPGDQSFPFGDNSSSTTIGNVTTDRRNAPIDGDLSRLLTEIPWMKFQVVAEPDLSVISTNPVLKQTITKVAESTVQHVIQEMTSLMMKAISKAATDVTSSAMQHISESVEVIVQGPAAAPRIQRSHSEHGYLHTLPEEQDIPSQNGHAAYK